MINRDLLLQAFSFPFAENALAEERDKKKASGQIL